MDTIDVNLKKKKRRKLFTNIAIASALSFAVVGVGVATIYNNDYQVSKAVEYDDDNNSITLSVDELNNYTFTNFGNYLYGNNNSSVVISNITYDYFFGDYANVYLLDDNDGASLTFLNDDNNGEYFDSAISFSYDVGIFETYTLYNSNVYESFLGSIYLYVSSSYYSDVKNAIELDIQANQPYTNDTFLNDIISLFVGGISATANGIGVGLSTLVGDIAIQNGAMSSFVSIVLIFGGIALAFALSRWVVNLISSLGQRNR